MSRSALLFLALGTLAGCNAWLDALKDDIVDAAVDAYPTVRTLAVGFGTRSDDRMTVAIGDTPVHIDTAVAFVRRIDFHFPAGVTCMDLDPATLVHPAYCTGDAIRVEGDWVVDLVSGVATPSMDGIVVPALDYTRVDVRFSDANGADATLADDTFVATGTVGDLPLSVRLRFNEDARFEGAVDGDAASTALLLLDVDAWFADVNLDACVAESSGSVTISDDAGGACGDLEGDVREAVRGSGHLAEDDDGDGVEDDHGDDGTETEDETETEDSGDDHGDDGTETEDETETEDTGDDHGDDGTVTEVEDETETEDTADDHGDDTGDDDTGDDDTGVDD